MAKRKSVAPKTVIQKRLQRCRALMKKANIGAYLITNRADQYYLTGFDGEDGAVVITGRQVHVITDGRFAETIKRQAPWASHSLRKNGLIPELASVTRKMKLRNLAFQDDQLSVQMLNDMRKSCKSVKFRSAPGIVNGMREIKDRSELRRIRRAIDLAEQAFKALRRKLRSGMSETEIAALLEYEMKKRGARGPSFPTIVAAGSNAALPHAEPGKRTITKGSLLLIDWGAQADGYCSDLTRVLFMGTIPPRFKTVYQIVLEAQVKAIAGVAPGRRMCDIDAMARAHIEANGYGDKFGHGLGHGIGLDVHELPRVRPNVTEILKPGMVITIEPGIYLPGLGGVRIEDDVLVTPGGHEVLTTQSKSLATALVR